MPFIFFSDRDIKHHEDTGHGFCPICECCIGCDCCVCGKEDSDDEDTYELVVAKPDKLDQFYTEEEQRKIYEVLKAKFQEEKLFQEAEAKAEEECESDDSWEPECCKCGTTTDQKGMGGVEHREDLCEWMCGRCYEYATRKEEC